MSHRLEGPRGGRWAVAAITADLLARSAALTPERCLGHCATPSHPCTEVFVSLVRGQVWPFLLVHLREWILQSRPVPPNVVATGYMWLIFH